MNIEQIHQIAINYTKNKLTNLGFNILAGTNDIKACPSMIIEKDNIRYALLVKTGVSPTNVIVSEMEGKQLVAYSLHKELTPALICCTFDSTNNTITDKELVVIDPRQHLPKMGTREYDAYVMTCFQISYREWDFEKVEKFYIDDCKLNNMYTGLRLNKKEDVIRYFQDLAKSNTKQQIKAEVIKVRDMDKFLPVKNIDKIMIADLAKDYVPNKVCLALKYKDKNLGEVSMILVPTFDQIGKIKEINFAISDLYKYETYYY